MNYRRIHIENSKVFITIVTSKRRPILIENINLLRNSFKEVKSKIKFEIDAIVILPDHIHMIIQQDGNKTYPEIVKRIKTNFSKNIDITKIENYSETESRKNKKEKDIWQRRYWEHTILDNDDLNKHIDYIHYNSVKHYGISPKDWEYSSFRKFVNNGQYELDWCNFEDKYNIKNLNLE